MQTYNGVSIRKFNREDIELKVNWINDPKVNTYLHYDLPLTIEGTSVWFERIKDQTDRLDCTIEYNGTPVGLCGLLGIDYKNNRAEFYYTIGDTSFQRRGICRSALKLLFDLAFDELKLNKLFCYTEVINTPSVCMLRKMGLKEEGILAEDIKRGDVYIDRYYFSCLAKEYKNNEINI